MKKQTNSQFLEIFKMGLSFMLFFFLSIIIKVLFFPKINFRAKDNLIFSLLTSTLLSIILIILYKNDLINELKDFKKKYKKYLSLGFKWWLTTYSITLVINLLLSKTGIGLSNNELAVRNKFLISYPLAFISTVFFAPFIEEMIFRKAFYNSFEDKRIYLIISTLIFALLHVAAGINTIIDFIYLSGYILMSFSFAYTMYKTKNIWTTIIIHSIHNFISAFILFFFI